MISKLNYPHIGIFILAWFVADLAIPLLIWIGRRLGAVDRPHSYKTHVEPVVFLGGIGIYFALSVALFSLLRFTSFESNLPLFGILFGGLFVVALGCVDDYRPISAVLKLIVLMVVTLIMWRFGVRMTIFPDTAAFGHILLYLNMGLTLLWLAGVTSAMNSFDNMDGAAGGIAAIASFCVFIIAWRTYQVSVSYVSIAILGACLGYLRYNLPPARMFLGDNGSFLLGFLLASMAVLGGWSDSDPVKSLVVVCCILCVPLYDITLSTVLRCKSGVVSGIREAIVYCGRDHLSHRFQALGFSKRETLMILYLFGLSSGGIGIFVCRHAVTRPQCLLVAGVGVFMLTILGAILDRAPVYGVAGAGDKAQMPGNQ
jgi:UDP-GlcNAc:undecaprenyl-phosphate GlcNAc-1-phosphate transferase